MVLFSTLMIIIDSTLQRDQRCNPVSVIFAMFTILRVVEFAQELDIKIEYFEIIHPIRIKESRHFSYIS